MSFFPQEFPQPLLEKTSLMSTSEFPMHPQNLPARVQSHPTSQTFQPSIAHRTLSSTSPWVLALSTIPPAHSPEFGEPTESSAWAPPPSTCPVQLSAPYKASGKRLVKGEGERAEDAQSSGMTLLPPPALQGACKTLPPPALQPT